MAKISRIRQILGCFPSNKKKEETAVSPSVQETTAEPKPTAVRAEHVLAQINAGPVQADRGGIKYTPDVVRRIIAGFLNNNHYEMSMYNALFDNIENLDYEHIEEHLRNIKIFLNCKKNFPNKPVENGYFYSKTGLDAFNLLLANYSTKGRNGNIAPISVPLANYTPEKVIKADERGLIDKLCFGSVIRKLVNMTDEEFAICKEKAFKSIQDTGKTYDELRAELETKLMPLAKGHEKVDMFLERWVNEYTIVPQLEMLDFLADYPVKIDNSTLIDFLFEIDVNNSESCKNILTQLTCRDDISAWNVRRIINLTNEKTEGILAFLLRQEDIPFDVILKHSESIEGLKEGLVSEDEILNEFNNDSFLKTMNGIRNMDINLTPNNTTPVGLNPRDIKPEALVLVHMTDYEPENDVILSTRDKLGGSRNSIHFALNHPVIEHKFGSWDELKYAIIMPYETAVNANSEGKFIEGMPNDIYTNGSVKIPEGSIIVKYDESLPDGAVKVSESQSHKGIKIIETSQYPHDLVPAVIEKMGYTNLKADGPVGLFSYGENNGKSISSAMENFRSWKEFCDSTGIKPLRHTGSPGEVAERIIENIDSLSANGSWNDKRHSNHNYKNDIMKAVNMVKKWKSKGYFVSYDIDKLSDIIKQSATPMEARQKLQSELGFHSTLKRESFEPCSLMLDDDLEIYEKWLEAVETNSDSLVQEIFEQELEYINL